MSFPPAHSSSRPVYVPGARRGRKRGRDGTRPSFTTGAILSRFEQEQFQHEEQEEPVSLSAAASKPPQQQRPEDFMDDHDFNEWGGPERLKTDYQRSKEENVPSATTTSAADFLWKVDELPKDVGRRLLRLWGWRDRTGGGAEASTTTSTAYVWRDEDDEGPPYPETSTTKRLHHHRRKKILLAQQQVRPPRPKLDTCGLGFDPHAQAPEFAAARARQSQSSKKQRSVYRMDRQLLTGGGRPGGGGGGGDLSQTQIGTATESSSKGKTDEDDNNYTREYETVDDFVGGKSVSGFALRDDDDDDVYDDTDHRQNGKRPATLQDDYVMEAYEHPSSEEETEGRVDATAASRQPSHRRDERHQQQALGQAFSSWAVGEPTSSAAATASTQPSNVSTATITSDGRPLLPGFVLGSDDTAASTSSKGPLPPSYFKGPDLPPADKYELKRHVFGPDEHPTVFKALARAQELQLEDQRHAATALQEQQGRGPADQVEPPPIIPPAAVPPPLLNLPPPPTGVLPPLPPAAAPSPLPPPPPPPPHVSAQESVGASATSAIGGTAWAGLAQAMKSRFTSASAQQGPTSKQSLEPTRSAGLSWPSPSTITTAATVATKLEESTGLPVTATTATTTAAGTSISGPEQAAKEVRINRTVMPFAPEPLLCKRFHVPQPSQLAPEILTTGTTTATAGPTAKEEAPIRRTRDEEHFQEEIFKPAISAKKLQQSSHGTDAGDAAKKVRPASLEKNGGSIDRSKKEFEAMTMPQEVDAPHAQRPAMSVYKSIYEPESETSSSSSSEAESDIDEVRIENGSKPQLAKDTAAPDSTAEQQDTLLSGFRVEGVTTKSVEMKQEPIDGTSSDEASSSVDRRDRRKRRKKERRKERRRERDEKKRKKRKKKSSKGSRSSDR